MASEQPDKAEHSHLQQPLAVEVAAEGVAAESKGDEVISIDLPAPQGWTKKFIPKKSGTPRRNEIVFTAPTGEEIKNKRQLDQYLKSHPGSPSASEFDWGTGDTPRRSARLTTKSKTTDTPESGSFKKRQKKSHSKKDETDGEGGSAEDEAAMDKSENGKDVEMKDVEAAAVDVDSAEAPVKNLEDKSDEGKQLGQDCEAASETFCDRKEVHPETGKVEAGGKHADAQVPQETVSDKVHEQPVEITVETGDKQAEPQVPDEAVSDKGQEQPEEIKEETGEEKLEAQVPQETVSDKGQVQPENIIQETAEEKEIVPSSGEEQPEEHKPEVGTKLSDAELPKVTNNEQPKETKENPAAKPAESKALFEEPVSSLTTSTEKDANKLDSHEIEEDTDTANDNQESVINAELPGES